MLPDKSPSRVYDIFTDDDDEFQDSNTASSSSCKTHPQSRRVQKRKLERHRVFAHGDALAVTKRKLLSMDFSVAVFKRNRGYRGYALEGSFFDDLNKWMPKDGIELNVKKDKKNAVWAPVLHLDEKETKLWLFFSESVKCLRLMSPENRWSPWWKHQRCFFHRRDFLDEA